MYGHPKELQVTTSMHRRHDVRQRCWSGGGVMTGLCLYAPWTFLLVLVCGEVPAGSLPMRSLHRQAFANAMRRLSEGMSSDQITAIVGKPDDIRTKGDTSISLPAD